MELGTQKFPRTQRRDEAERLGLVADAKKRMIGIDKEALDRQVAEKAAAKQAERARDLYYDQMGDMFSAKLSVLEQQRQEVRTGLAKEVQSFQLEQQRKEQRREWDLSMPEGVKSSMPARIGDVDPRCGPASIQQFEGEDLTAAERKKRQLAQQAAWCAAQVGEKEAAVARVKEQEGLFAAQAAANAAHATYIEAATREARSRLAHATASANGELVQAHQDRAAILRAADEAAKAAELEYQLTNKFQTEDPSCAVSVTAPWRVRKDHFKGFNDSQKADILATQRYQVEELNARRAAEREGDLMFAAQQDAVLRALDMKSQQVEEFKRDQARQAAQFLRTQAVEKAGVEATNKAAYTANMPTDEFFRRFGTSAR